jgi:hypothetical protein
VAEPRHETAVGDNGAMTRFEHVNRYAATPEQVRAMLLDPAFRERVCQAQKSADHRVELREERDVTVVEVHRTQSMAGAPAAATKVVGSTIRLVQRERWTGPDSAELEMEIPGKPGHLRGAVRLRATAGGCEQHVTGEAKVSIPLVGDKLEQLVTQLLTKALVREAEVGQAWLVGSS